jgi:hypothetical protein
MLELVVRPGEVDINMLQFLGLFRQAFFSSFLVRDVSADCHHSGDGPCAS